MILTERGTRLCRKRASRRTALSVASGDQSAATGSYDPERVFGTHRGAGDAAGVQQPQHPRHLDRWQVWHVIAAQRGAGDDQMVRRNVRRAHHRRSWRPAASNTPATWTGGTYGASSQRSVAPEPRRWSGGMYAASSEVIPAARPTLATTSRSQLSASAGSTQRTSAVSSARSPSRAQVAIWVPNRTWRSREPLDAARDPQGRRAPTSPHGVTDQRAPPSGPRSHPTRGTWLCVTPNPRDMVVNVKSEAMQMLRGLPKWESQL